MPGKTVETNNAKILTLSSRKNPHQRVGETRERENIPMTEHFQDPSLNFLLIYPLSLAKMAARECMKYLTQLCIFGFQCNIIT